MNLFRTNKIFMMWVFLNIYFGRENLFEFFFHTISGYVCITALIIAIIGIVKDGFDKDAKAKYAYNPESNYTPPKDDKYYENDNYSEQYKYHRNENRQRTYTPPSYVPFDSYSVLGIPRMATEEDIRRAYLNEMKKHHPDLHRNDSESVRMQEEEKAKDINRAYEYLVK